MDICIEQVVKRVLEKEGIVVITADHGNCEEMICPLTGACFTAHTTNQVPLFWSRKSIVNAA